MIQVTTDEKLLESNDIPNVVAWSWIHKGLKLKGVDILIFAYLFTLTLAGTDIASTSLTAIADWIGISRQTLSKRIDNLPGIIKAVSQSNNDGRFYTHNLYEFDRSVLSEMCEHAGDDVFEEYKQTTQEILILNFPDKKELIISNLDTIIDTLDRDKATTKTPAPYSFADVVDDNITETTEQYEDSGSTNEQEENLKNNIPREYVLSKESISKVNSKYNVAIAEHLIGKGYDISNLQTTITPTTKRPNKIPKDVLKKMCTSNTSAKSGLLDKPTKNKKQTKEEKQQVLLQTVISMNESFVALECDNDAEILDYLNKYAIIRIVDAEKGKQLVNATQWEAILHPYHNCPNNIILTDILKALAGNARTNGYTVDKYKEETSKEQQQNKKLEIKIAALHRITNEYIESLPKSSSKFEEVLNSYVDEVFIPSGRTTGQLRTLLASLDKYEDINIKTQVVSNAYSSNSKTFWVNYDKNGNAVVNGVTVQSTVTAEPIDMEAKKQAIADFIKDWYFCLVPAIEINLTEYINSNVGKAMPIDTFKAELQKLLYHGGNQNDIAANIKEATNLQKSVLCVEDYERTKRIKHSYITLDKYVNSTKRNRLNDCIKVYQSRDRNKPTLPDYIIDKLKSMGVKDH